jgi:LDH2 family malate/lactate/ureidoglycolate dehydrogenase
VAPFETPIDGVTVDADELRRWTVQIVRRVSTPADIAEDVATVLVASDLRGIASHGTFRLPVYVSLAEAGVIEVAARPTRDGGTDVISRWDAANGWGPHSGRILIDDAIDRASRLGLAASVAHRASHFGIAGWYSMRAAARGFVGITMSNSSPLVAPTRGRTRLLGTNPIAVAAPAGRFGMFVLDMATSAITWGRVIVAARRAGFLTEGIAIDGDGRPTIVPSDVLDRGALMPLGGGETTAGYKGYGLALMVDVLTGVLAGASFGSGVIPFSTTLGPSDLGQLFMAIAPASIAPGFEERMEALCQELVDSPVAPGSLGRVLIPGEPETAAEIHQRAHGIALERGHHESLVDLGEALGIVLPAVRPLHIGTAG